MSEDLHKETAEKLYGREPSKSEREIGKVVNQSVVYGFSDSCLNCAGYPCNLIQDMDLAHGGTSGFDERRAGMLKKTAADCSRYEPYPLVSASVHLKEQPLDQSLFDTHPRLKHELDRIHRGADQNMGEFE